MLETSQKAAMLKERPTERTGETMTIYHAEIGTDASYVCKKKVHIHVRQNMLLCVGTKVISLKL